MALGVHAENGASATSVSTLDVPITTTVPNCILVAIGATVHASAFRTLIVSGASLTWEQVAAQSQWNGNGTARNNLHMWVALAASPITAQNIRATFNATASNVAMIVAAISGAHVADGINGIYDANANSKRSNTNATSSSITPNVSSFSTSNPDDIIIGAFSSSAGFGSSADLANGYSQLDSTRATAGLALSAERKIVSALQSNITVSFANAGRQFWGMQAFAIKAAALTGGRSFGTIIGG
jgi:hypothetical protein